MAIINAVRVKKAGSIKTNKTSGFNGVSNTDGLSGSGSSYALSVRL